MFIQEWTKGFEKKYKFVERLGGAGDKGRDVVAYITDPNAPAPEWDNYQCKHYKTPVQPSHMWSDFGKLCYYCWKKDYSPPKIYRIVAPLEVSPSFKELLKDPAAIREGLKLNWGSHCERGGITTKADVPLDGDLASYVESFDFSIIGYVPIVDILEQHAKTPFWDIRFKELPPQRPPVTLPPQLPSSLETRYLQQLLEAYSDHEKTALNTVEEIKVFQNHFRHYERSREDFYKAESLYRFTKDFVALGSFEEFKKQILDGVIDICDGDFDSALDRLKATTQEAARLPPCPGHLGNLATIGDKKGSCHHLANEDKLIWKK
ncbi:ABC-three component system protein [Haloferula sp.]|uniref:ABC-three component system protein n=1 Tax=Haloferula sp. TaxID=2497595 RepID=UPI003C74B9EA